MNPPKTEGQRALVEVNASHDDVAKRIGVSKSSVSYWRSGAKIPGPGARRAIEEAYGIDSGAWDRAPGESAPEPKKAPPAPRVQGDRPTTLDEVNEELRLLAELRGEHLLPSERLKIADSVGKLLAIKARLEREVELFEDRAVKAAPFWRRLKSKIVEALKPYPDAARAVAEALGGDDA